MLFNLLLNRATTHSIYPNLIPFSENVIDQIVRLIPSHKITSLFIIEFSRTLLCSIKKDICAFIIFPGKIKLAQNHKIKTVKKKHKNKQNFSANSSLVSFGAPQFQVKI